MDQSKSKARARAVIVGALAALAVGMGAGQVLAQPPGGGPGGGPPGGGPPGGGPRGPQKSPGERAIEYRQAIYTVISGNFGPAHNMGDGKMPMNATELQKRSMRVAELAKMLDDAFPAESNIAGKTKAKPEIWTDNAGFQEKLTAFINKSDAWAAAAKSGDAAKIKSTGDEVADTCKACHDKYREE